MINYLFYFCLGSLIGYLVRMFVEDTDREHEMMVEYQNVISEIVKELNKNDNR